jgi:hypothetical protein
LIVSLTSLSRWYDTGASEGGSSFVATLPTTTEKPTRGPGGSTDKTAADVSPARGVGSRQRTSGFEMVPTTPGPHGSLQDASISESK